MSRLIRLMKSTKERDLLRDEELQRQCSKCGKRPATDKDGFCDHCRLDDILTQLTEKK